MIRTITNKIIVFLALLLCCFSCQRENVPGSEGHNRLISEPTVDKTSSGYLCIVHLGHDGKNCPGCVMVNGKYMHVDCQGHGTACQVSASVTINQTGSIVTATTTDTFGLTSLDFFLMPDRSLDYEDEKGNHIFLNIPSQLLFRDTTTQQFTFTGLSFSDTPLY